MFQPDLCWFVLCLFGLTFVGWTLLIQPLPIRPLPVWPVSVRKDQQICLLRGVFICIEKAFFLCYVVAMYQVAKLQCLDYRHCRIHRNCKPNVSVARGGAACARSHAYSAVTAGPSNCWANGKSRCALRVLLTEKHGLLYFHEISEAHYCQNFQVLAMNYEVAATNFQSKRTHQVLVVLK